MKSFVRWGTTVSLVGSTLLATIFGGNASVLALTEQQIKEKLDQVPVFLITNNKGIPLTRTLPTNAQNGQNGQNTPKTVSVINVFMNGQEAQTIVNQLSDAKKKDPKLAEVVKDLQVTPVPLGMIYQRLQESANKPDRPLFVFEPAKQEVQGAMTLLRQTGKDVKEIASVPVFIVRSPDKGYVSVKRKTDNKEVIPLFLSKKDAQALLQQVKTQVPKADIQVVDIDNVIKTLREKNDAWLNQVAIVPSTETMQYVVSKRGNAKPAAAPAPKK
ncbi:hypothetical protein NUACC21_22890 [Scytonema sp. NUACC21]